MADTGLYLGGDRQRLLAKLRSLVADLDAAIYPEVSDIPVLMDQWAVSRREVPCLIGKAHGHPRLFDGSSSFSSELFFLDVDQQIARTLSRWYRLGTAVELDT